MIPLKLIIRNLLVTMSVMIVIGGYLECEGEVVVLDTSSSLQNPIDSLHTKVQTMENFWGDLIPHNLFYFSPSIAFQNKLFVELGITYGTIVGDDSKSGHLMTEAVLYSFKLSNELYCSSNLSIVIIGPKISFESNMLELTHLRVLPVLQASIGYRLSLINYTNFEQNMVCFIPEVGLELPGYNYFSIFYGYNVFIGGTRFNEISNSRLNITFNIPI